jgi:hypothetical protein
METPRGYPRTIELKVDRKVGERTDETTFNTENQLKTAEIVEKLWPATFLDIAEEAPVSRPIVGDIVEDFFGPEGTGLTFGEIEEHFGSFKQFQRARTLGTVNEILEKDSEELEGIAAILGTPDLQDEVSDREFEMYLLGRKEAWEEAFGEGFTLGWRSRGEHEKHGSQGKPRGDLASEFGSAPNY